MSSWLLQLVTTAAQLKEVGTVIVLIEFAVLEH